MNLKGHRQGTLRNVLFGFSVCFQGAQQVLSENQPGGLLVSFLLSIAEAIQEGGSPFCDNLTSVSKRGIPRSKCLFWVAFEATPNWGINPVLSKQPKQGMDQEQHTHMRCSENLRGTGANKSYGAHGGQAGMRLCRYWPALGRARRGCALAIPEFVLGPPINIMDLRGGLMGGGYPLFGHFGGLCQAYPGTALVYAV